MQRLARTSWLAASALLLICSLAPAAATPTPTPMVDGDCAEYPALQAQQVTVADGVTLFIHQDAHYVWLCYTYPAGSMGMLDMTLKAPRLAAPLVLHASVQLGEWPLNRPDLVPPNAESSLWWNTSGWTANTIGVNGLDTSGPQARLRFKNARAREAQLSKQRFGQGDWQFTLKIYGIQTGTGKHTDLLFPADGSFFNLKAF